MAGRWNLCGICTTVRLLYTSYILHITQEDTRVNRMHSMPCNSNQSVILTQAIRSWIVYAEDFWNQLEKQSNWSKLHGMDPLVRVPSKPLSVPQTRPNTSFRTNWNSTTVDVTIFAYSPLQHYSCGVKQIFKCINQQCVTGKTRYNFISIFSGVISVGYSTFAPRSTITETQQQSWIHQLRTGLLWHNLLSC